MTKVTVLVSASHYDLATMKRFSASKSIFLLLCIAGLLNACAQLPEQEPFVPPVFPPPPEKPRFYFEHMLISTAQVKSTDATTRWRRLLTGESERGSGFAKPFDVSACRGRVYVSDSVRRTVLAFDFPGGRWFPVGDDEPGALVKPLGIASDASCNLYVADTTPRRIAIYDQDGQFLRAVGGAEYFERVAHVTVDPTGTKIFAVDTGGVGSQNHHIRVFDAMTGAHLYDIGKRGDGDGELNLPRDIEFGPDNRLYIVDSGNFRVQVFEQDGTFVRTFGTVGRRVGQFARPKGIAADPAGNVYVSDASHGNFQIFTPEGQLLLFIGGRSNTSEPAKYTLPAGIDVDEDGRVYMVGQFFRKVEIYRPAELESDQGYLGVWAMQLAEGQ